jgi:hypothetical protein
VKGVSIEKKNRKNYFVLDGWPHNRREVHEGKRKRRKAKEKLTAKDKSKS